MMYLSEVANLLSTTLNGEDNLISSMSINTRELLPGQLFIALKGEQFDGHDFLQSACDKKAVGAVVSKSVQLTIPTIQVADTRMALGQIAAYHRRRFDLPIIAVTGSCGKTTTKTMIASILSQMGMTLAPEKSFNNEIGVPLTLLQLSDQHRYAVIEMGANHVNEIAYLSRLANQDVAVITNVAPAHLEGFGSIEGVARAKGEIYTALSEKGIAVLNVDDQFANYWKESLVGRSIISFGIKNSADVTAKDIELDEEGRAQFKVDLKGVELSIHLPLLGTHNVMNALAAIAATSAVGATRQAIEAGLREVTAVSKRLVKYTGLAGSLIIDDTYNANPLSVKAALEMLALRKEEKIFVFGDMAELGTQKEALHIEIGELAKQLGINRLYACGRLSQFTVKAFGQNATHFPDQQSLIAALKATLHAKSVVLVKGSRSSQMENIVQAILK